MAQNQQPKTRPGERGFPAMDPEEQREIARKYGEEVSKGCEHMAEIGPKGGETSHSYRSGNRGKVEARAAVAAIRAATGAATWAGSASRCRQNQ